MIINVPLSIDDKLVEEKLAQDAEAQVIRSLTDRVDKILKERHYFGSNATDGLRALVYQTIDKCIDDHKDQIIEIAADKLAERLARTKAAKEIVK